MSSRFRLLMFVLLTLLTEAAPAQRTPADDEKIERAAAVTARLRGQLAEWIRTNIDAPADRELASELAADMDRKLAAGENISFVVDSAAARSTRGRLVATWAGQLHTFDVTDQQCRAAGVTRRGAVGSSSASTEASNAWEPLPFRLDALRIDDPEKITGERPITGRLTCRKGEVVPPGRIVVRTMYRSGRTSGVSYEFKDAIPEDGKLTISINPLEDKSGGVQFGPMLILVDVLTTGVSETGIVASNAVGAVVDVMPDPEGSIVAGLRLMNRIAEILAGVKDETTAAQAVKDYREAVTKNRALITAMDARGPLPPDLDAALNKKYEPQINAVIARLQAEMERLDRAPFAGPAFIDRLDKSVSEK